MKPIEKITEARRKKLAAEADADRSRVLAAERERAAARRAALQQEMAAGEKEALVVADTQIATAEARELREQEGVEQLLSGVISFKDSPPWVLPIFWGVLREQLAAALQELGLADAAGDPAALLAAARPIHFLNAFDAAHAAEGKAFQTSQRPAWERAWRLASLAGAADSFQELKRWLPAAPAAKVGK